MKNKIIPITISADDSYVKHVSVVINSILCNSSKEYNYEFIIFDNEIRDETKELLNESIKRHKNASVRFLNLRKKTARFLTTNIKSTTIFDRLFIPEVLKEYDKVIQLDADMVVLDDISKLYNEDISNVYVACVLDRFIQQHIKDKDNVWLRDVRELQEYNWETYIKNILRLSKPDEYFNAGMMVMNLRLMRRDRISEKLISFLIRHQPLALCDQDALNAVIKNKKKILSPHWNFVIDFSIIYPNDAYAKIKDQPLGIIHRKLWDEHFQEKYSKFYYKYLPSEFSNFQHRKIQYVKPEDITFLVTGKVSTMKNYTTLECIASVKKYFPASRIILATWEGEDIGNLSKVVDKILTLPPMEPQYSAHIESCAWKAPNSYDLQQFCVHQGLLACETQYVVRLRSDFVLTGKKFLSNYNKLNSVFDSYEADCKVFNQRVLIHETLSINPHAPDLAFTQHPADLFHFGLRDDLLKLWDGSPMPRNVYNYFNEHPDVHNPCMFASQYIIEQYLWLALLEREGKLACIPANYLASSPELIELTDRFFVSNFLILDEKELGIRSKFDSIQRLQKYRFFSFEHFCQEYFEHVDKCNAILSNLLEVFKTRHKFSNSKKEFLTPFVWIIERLKPSIKWLLSVFRMIHYYTREKRYRISIYYCELRKQITR